MNIVKLLISVLLFGCLLNMPYGYFQFIRIVACIGFFWLAYQELENNKKIIGLVTICCGILFNPVFKIYFKRTLWNKIDVIIATSLIVWIIIDIAFPNSKLKKS